MSFHIHDNCFRLLNVPNKCVHLESIDDNITPMFDFQIMNRWVSGQNDHLFKHFEHANRDKPDGKWVVNLNPMRNCTHREKLDICQEKARLLGIHENKTMNLGVIFTMSGKLVGNFTERSDERIFGEVFEAKPICSICKTRLASKNYTVNVTGAGGSDFGLDLDNGVDVYRNLSKLQILTCSFTCYDKVKTVFGI